MGGTKRKKLEKRGQSNGTQPKVWVEKPTVLLLRPHEVHIAQSLLMGIKTMQAMCSGCKKEVKTFNRSAIGVDNDNMQRFLQSHYCPTCKAKTRFEMIPEGAILHAGSDGKIFPEDPA